MSNFIKILDEWAKYSEYDPNQSQFNLFSTNYEFHQTGKKIEEILTEYDSTGAFAVIKAKLSFDRVLKNSNVNAYDIVVDPQMLSEERRIYELFQSNDVKEVEKALFERINLIYASSTGEKLIGEMNQEDAAPIFFECIDGVTNQIKRCQTDLYKKGGILEPVRYISTKINVFPALSVCLATLETAIDGLYICYIDAGGSADGYFGFYFVNNGNLFSVNDRVDEAVQGMHRNARNARWTDGKQDSIFPYSLLSYSEHDYLGYATRYHIDEGNLSFKNLKKEELYPLIIAIVLLSGKYVGRELDEPIKYVDSLLPVNRELLPENSFTLMKVGENSIALNHQQLDFSFQTEGVLNGSYSSEFNHNGSGKRGEGGFFCNENQIMVDLWGRGFECPTEGLMKSDSGNIKLLMDKKNKELPPAEFIGTEKRMRTQAYYRVRKLLAAYMREQIHEAWLEYGGDSAVKAWYKAALERNRGRLIQMALLWYAGFINGHNENIRANTISWGKKISASCQEKENYPDEVRYGIYNGEFVRDRYDRRYICLQAPDLKANTFIAFKPMDWSGIEALAGMELPDIIKGWMRDRRYAGNPNLDVTDAVAEVGTPYDDRIAKGIYCKEDDWRDDTKKNFEYCKPFYFTCVLGFSKRGLNALLKENGFKFDKNTKKYLKDSAEVAGMDCYNYMMSQPYWCRSSDIEHNMFKIPTQS